MASIMTTLKIAAIVCFMIVHSIVSQRDSTMKQPSIVIVGAGPSGIAAASKLFENGFNNVKILEAENRIGGRINTEKIGNYSVDLGAEWVHGEKGNVVYELVAPYDIVGRTGKQHYEKSQDFIDSLGNPVSEELKNNVIDFYYKYIVDSKPDNNTDSESLGEYLENMFDKEFQSNSKMLDDKKMFLSHLELYIITMESAETWRDVAIEDDGFQGYPGDQQICWKTLGYSTILGILMKHIPNPKQELPVMKNVLLNSEVKSIDYSGSKGEPVTVTTEKGQIYKADHVIVTFSLGVLKAKHNSLFIPPLPDQQIKTIENLGYGCIAKIFLLFDKPFWDLDNKKGLQISFLWNDSERKSVEQDPEKNWVLGMLGIQNVDYKPNLLVILVTGKYAKMMEQLPNDKVLTHTVETLHRFLDKKFNVTDPTEILRTQWCKNPHFRGTFTYRSTESQKKKVHAETLQEPVNANNLAILFAGEATSPNRFSTVDGAIQSGWKAADKLINRYKN